MSGRRQHGARVAFALATWIAAALAGRWVALDDSEPVVLERGEASAATPPSASVTAAAPGRSTGVRLLALVLALSACSRGAVAEPPAARAPVLVELFTSQGCSSCPPADRVLAELAERDDVIALAFHVDYWNDLGWADPFSSAAWSARQRGYHKRVYTPQLIVDGRADVIGSQRRKVDRAVSEARARAPGGTVTATARRRGRSMVVDVRATGRDGEIWIAVYQRRADTRVRRGENAGRRLVNRNMVRALARAGAVSKGHGRGRVTVALDPAWSDDLGVVVFVQHPDTREVHAAARAAPVVSGRE